MSEEAPPPLPEAPGPRTLPAVLSAALEKDETLVMIVGAYGAALPAGDPQLGSHVNVDIGGSVIRIPTLAGMPSVPGTPAYIVATKDQVLALGSVGGTELSGGGVPIGGILPFGGSTAPSGFLLCDGAAFSTATYPALYAVLGVANTPDLVKRVPVGAGGGSTPGQSDGLAQGSRGVQHHHSFSGSVSISGNTSSDGDHGHGNAGSHDHGPAGGGGFAKNQGQTAQGAAGTGWTRYNVVDYTSGTDTDGDHSHGNAGSHNHSFSGSGTASGDTSGGGPLNGPSYLVLNFIIRAI